MQLMESESEIHKYNNMHWEFPVNRALLLMKVVKMISSEVGRPLIENPPPILSTLQKLAPQTDIVWENCRYFSMTWGTTI
jgi:hypothetical protein